MPDVARGVFHDRLELATRYAALLATDGVTRGLIGPREAPRLWERHLLNSAVLAEVVPQGAAVADLGSGAGLPGLVLAIRRADLRVTLVEPLQRRSRFLDEVARELGLDGQVEVVRARAEELHGRRTFDLVTSRALAPLPRLVSWSLPLVAAGGAMLALKGDRAAQEVAEAGSELARWGVRERVDVVRLGAEVLDPQATVIRVEIDEPTRLRWSSSDGAGKRPATSRRSARTGRRGSRQR